MGLDKAIEHGKEHREQYRESTRHWKTEANNKSMRNHGSNDWAKANRTHGSDILEEAAKEAIESFSRGEEDV